MSDDPSKGEAVSLIRKIMLTAATGALAAGALGAMSAPAHAAACPTGPTVYVGTGNFYPYPTKMIEQATLNGETATTCRYYGEVVWYSLGYRSSSGFQTVTITRPR
jgi:hypothetical protein